MIFRQANDLKVFDLSITLRYNISVSTFVYKLMLVKSIKLFLPEPVISDNHRRILREQIDQFAFCFEIMLRYYKSLDPLSPPPYPPPAHAPTPTPSSLRIKLVSSIAEGCARLKWLKRTPY
jgi:hypothetical protein